MKSFKSHHCERNSRTIGGELRLNFSLALHTPDLMTIWAMGKSVLKVDSASKTVWLGYSIVSLKEVI